MNATAAAVGEEIVAELRAAGLVGDGPTTAQVSAGPMMTRCAVSAGDRHLWADAVGPAWRGPSPAEPPGWLAGAAVAASDEHFGPALPTTLDRGAWVYQFGWAPQLLIERLTGPWDTIGVNAVLAAAGAYLRRLHDVWLDDGEAPRTPPPVALRRVLDPPAGSLASAPRWRRTVERVAGAFAAGPASALHGQPALAHLFVPRRGASGPTACLTGWIEPCRGPRAFDVGHLMADLLELAGMSGAAGRHAFSNDLITAARAVRDGYVGAGEAALPDSMWRDAAAAAAVKVLDHEIRMRQAFGPSDPSSRLLGGIADAVVDESTALGAVFGAGRGDQP